MADTLTDAEQTDIGELADKCWNFAMDNIGNSDVVSQSDLAKAAIALGAASSRMKAAALDNSLQTVTTQ